MKYRRNIPQLTRCAIRILFCIICTSLFHLSIFPFRITFLTHVFYCELVCWINFLFVPVSCCFLLLFHCCVHGCRLKLFATLLFRSVFRERWRLMYFFPIPSQNQKYCFLLILHKFPFWLHIFHIFLLFFCMMWK
jgi:hypothetical protein